jgi:endonuclease YncB( thermonuclease family)
MSACALSLAVGVCAAIVGSPTVVDGDTLRFGSQTVRIFGIDAEERNEPNGPWATANLRKIVASSYTIRCEPTGDQTHGRTVAICYTASGNDVGMLLVAGGVALDCARYSGGRYRQYEPANIRTQLTQKPYCRSK